MACLFCGRDILKNSTNPKKRTLWLTEMEDSLERRQESYDGTFFAFLQKTGQFRNNCHGLLVGKVVKYNLYVKNSGRASPSKEAGKLPAML